MTARERGLIAKVEKKNQVSDSRAIMALLFISQIVKLRKDCREKQLLCVFCKQTLFLQFTVFEIEFQSVSNKANWSLGHEFEP